MGVVVLLGFGYAVSVYGRPFLFALGYAALSLLLGVVTGGALLDLLGQALVALAYCTGYFWLIDRHSESIGLFFVILVAGALLWFLVPIWLYA